MYYLLFDTPETAEHYNNLMSDPATRVTADFPSGYFVTGEDISELYRMNMAINDMYLS